MNPQQELSQLNWNKKKNPLKARGESQNTVTQSTETQCTAKKCKAPGDPAGTIGLAGRVCSAEYLAVVVREDLDTALTGIAVVADLECTSR